MAALSLNLSEILHYFDAAALPPLDASISRVATPDGYLPYARFNQQFNLGEASTEKDNPRTSELSYVMHRNPVDGLTMLLNEEKEVISGFKSFFPHLDAMVPPLVEKIREGGRTVFVGVGSSGRVALDLAAKATAICPELKCLGIMGGGDCALILAKEELEDSCIAGEMSASKLDLNAQDTVILISASGSASFNIGFGHSAANLGCKVYLFYNSQEIPARTRDLFNRTNNPAEPLLLDIGPQAILGSTRLQAYSIARICFSYLLGQTIAKCGHSIDTQEISAETLCKKLLQGIEKIEKALPEIKNIIAAEFKTFSSPNSNFRRSKDETQAGYVTLLGTPSSVRELIIDSVEVPPSYSLNPCRREERDPDQRRPEYQAYLVDADNKTAWKMVLGREACFVGDWAKTSHFLLSATAEGQEGFAKRPQGSGNCVIGADVLRSGQKISASLLEKLREVKLKGADTFLLVVADEPQNNIQIEIESSSSQLVMIDGIKDDPMGLTSSQILKWVSNLISNGTMIMMEKVLGNRMIDVRPLNNKLIDRCMRNISAWWFKRHGEILNREHLYELVIDTYERQKETFHQGKYTPSTMKIVLTMYEKRCVYDRAITILQEIQENLSLL